MSMGRRTPDAAACVPVRHAWDASREEHCCLSHCKMRGRQTDNRRGKKERRHGRSKISSLGYIMYMFPLLLSPNTDIMKRMIAQLSSM